MAQNGYRIILWSNDLGGYETGVRADKQVEKALANLKNGDIILGHFGSYNSYEVIKSVVEEALNRGYEFVTISELISNL
jgi:peptidoglycan/xylan/chitin deacetylase (PgdA/CDA1 family)